MSKERRQCRRGKSSLAKSQERLPRTTGRFGCRRSTWTTYGQVKLSKKASRHCVFSIIVGDFTGHYRFKKGLYGLSDVPIVFQKHIDKVLEFKLPVWLEDIICVTNRTADDNERELREMLSKLEKAGSKQARRKPNY